MTNIVEKKTVTEMREVEVEKVVLTLDMEQAEFITALLRATIFSSLALVEGMETMMEDMKTTVNNYRRFSVQPSALLVVRRDVT